MSKEGLSETEYRPNDDFQQDQGPKILHVHRTRKSAAYMEMLRTQHEQPAVDARGYKFQQVFFKHGGETFRTVGPPKLLGLREHELVDGGHPEDYQAEELLVIPQ